MNVLQGKKGLIMGVANEKSIAWGVAELAHENGAELAFSYQGEMLKKRVEPLANSIGCNDLYECDVQNDESIEKLFKDVEAKWGTLDFVVHSIAFSDKNELRGHFSDTTRANFKLSMDVSCYSFIAVTKYAQKLMPKGGSLITMTYYGSEKVVPNYNVMGVAKAALECATRYLAMDLGEKNIRVNSVSAGPMRTLASAGIGDMKLILDYNQQQSPLKKNVSLEEVAGCSVFLLSDLSNGITGENIHVDAGYHIVGVPKKAKVEGEE